ncbi:MAG: hypothetical protein BWY44_00761 [Candidatus Omnitrophica bacterium ADurb.Bin292]|nr:MAG: hypothetical protein BWY44_00761 [Candidatus Omnitrophica bacterium ADurb.Bin292]
MLNHFRRTRGAIHPDHVHGKHFKRGDSRGKLGAQQHSPRRFNRNLGNDGEATAGFGKTLLSRDHRGLDLEQILAGLDNQSVNSSGHQPLDLLSGRVLQVIKSNVPQGWELGPGPDGSEDEPGMLRSRIFSRGFPGNLSGFFVKLISTGLKPVIGKNNPIRAKAVRLDGITTDREKVFVNLTDGFGLRNDKVLVATVLAAKILWREKLFLEIGAHGAIKHHDPFFTKFKKRMSHKAGIVAQLPTFEIWHLKFRGGNLARMEEIENLLCRDRIDPLNSPKPLKIGPFQILQSVKRFQEDSLPPGSHPINLIQEGALELFRLE